MASRGLSPYLEPPRAIGSSQKAMAASRLAAEREFAMSQQAARSRRPKASGEMSAPAHRPPPTRPGAPKVVAHRAPPAPPPQWDPSTRTFTGTMVHAFHGGPGSEAAAVCRAYAAQLSEASNLAGATSAPQVGDNAALVNARAAAREQKKLADHREGTQRALLERLLRSEKRYEWQQKQLQRVSTQLAQVRSRLAAVASERDAALDAARIAAEETESLREEVARLHEELLGYGGGGSARSAAAYEQQQQQQKAMREAAFFGGSGAVGGGFQAVAEATLSGGGTPHGIDGWPTGEHSASATELPPSGLEATLQAAQENFNAISSAYVGAGGDPATVGAAAAEAGLSAPVPPAPASALLADPASPAPLPALNNSSSSSSVVATASAQGAGSPPVKQRRAPPPLPEPGAEFGGEGSGTGTPPLPPTPPPDEAVAKPGLDGEPPPPAAAQGHSSPPPPPAAPVQERSDPALPPPPAGLPPPAATTEQPPKPKKRCASFAQDPVTDTKLLPMDEDNVRARESVPYNEDPSDEEDEETEDPPPPPPAGALGGIALPPPAAPAADAADEPAADAGVSSFTAPDMSLRKGEPSCAVPSATAPFGKKKKDLSNPFG